jgi:pantoate--beta-alanine ligase
VVVASIFVNPTQFNRAEDLQHYPRTLDQDLDVCRAAGVDLLFTPGAAEMYPQEPLTWVDVPSLAEHLCGPGRPGHFRGVATVVMKLFQIVQPDRAYFGEKDAQQLAIIRRMVKDLDVPVTVVPVATVREPDGLAMSSRNVYLSPEQRAKAGELHRALLAGREAAGDGVRAIVAEVTDKLVVGFPPYLETDDDPGDPRRPRFSVDYVAVVDPDGFAVVDEWRPDAVRPDRLIIAAARLGETRLLDNVAVGEAASAQTTTPHEPDSHGGPASDQED